MSLKRRRDEDGGVPDIPQLGGQVLPVANYLPEDFDGDPGDGMEYLFMVRLVWSLLSACNFTAVLTL
jgi:hypothetical protein